MIIKLIILHICLFSVYSVFDIEKFGARANSDTLQSQIINKKAIQTAVQAAILSQNQRIVKIPPHKTFYTFPFIIQNVQNFTLTVLGKLSASKSVRYWPKNNLTHKNLHFIDFINCTNIEINGGGRIDGRGYHWWMLMLVYNKKFLPLDDRPVLVHMEHSQFIKIHDIVLKNSPQMTLRMDHCYDVQIYNVNIKVNTTAQINLLKKLNLEGMIPMFPFNTDGIDPSGARYHIYNMTVQNYDDVVVPKPGPDDDCTRDMLVQNFTVKLGVGMSIGSVPPRSSGSCVRNITFRNVYMQRPFKGIYVKTNPGNSGHGNIENIYYQNFLMNKPIWWAIYIGPQQMKQPTGKGPGCMIYPLDPKGTCQTQPLVTIDNITLQNIKIQKSLLYPITIRCNVSNPCTNINFIGVMTDEWKIGEKSKGYICEFASGYEVESSPKIQCLSNNNRKVEKNESQDRLLPQQYDKEIEKKDAFFKINESLSFFKEELKQQDPVSILNKVTKQIINAIQEIGYNDEEDDQFTYDLNEIQFDQSFYKIL